MSKKNRDILYGLIILATLIISIIGASLAYFSYKTGSKEKQVKGRTAILNIMYEDGQQISAQASLLIPSSLDVVKRVYQKNVINGDDDITKNKCIDDNNRQVCSIYRFSVTSDLNRDIYAILNTEDNEFSYLSYAVKDVTNNTWLILDGNNNEYLDLDKCTNNNEISSDDCYTGSGEGKVYSKDGIRAANSIFGYNSDGSLKKYSVNASKQVYDIVLFIKENNRDQNIDRGKKYLGNINVMITDDVNMALSGK